MGHSHVIVHLKEYQYLNSTAFPEEFCFQLQNSDQKQVEKYQINMKFIEPLVIFGIQEQNSLKILSQNFFRKGS